MNNEESIMNVKNPITSAIIINPAESAYRRLIEMIKNFEEKLNDEEEIGLRLVNSPSGVLHVQSMRYWGPDFIIFSGIS